MKNTSRGAPQIGGLGRVQGCYLSVTKDRQRRSPDGFAPMPVARSSTRRVALVEVVRRPPGVRVPEPAHRPGHPVEVPAEVLATEALLGRDLAARPEHPLDASPRWTIDSTSLTTGGTPRW